MQKCSECGRDIKKLNINFVVELAKTQDPNLTEDIYKANIEKVTGEKMKDPEGFICPNCAQIYGKDGNNTGVKLQPVDEVRKYYGYSKEN